MDAAVPARVEPLVQDEAAFRAFYERTARQVWAYLYRATHDPALADDLLQETYYRWLRVRRSFESESHRERYLFRIAVNLVMDARRCRRFETVPVTGDEISTSTDDAASLERRTDVERAMRTLSPRDRDMLWLAYADGASHEEIAVRMGIGRRSVKTMLFRARQRLAQRLRAAAAVFERVGSGGRRR
jgi:RNA polymerase sigma-70 factor (ECF subfamily)